MWFRSLPEYITYRSSWNFKKHISLFFYEEWYILNHVFIHEKENGLFNYLEITKMNRTH